ncbi:MAG: TRAP transporter small permease [Sneathiella sp.]
MDSIAEHHPASGPKFLLKVESALTALSAFCILGIGLLISVSIITRAVFDWSLPDSTIFVRELMIGAVILPLAMVTAERTHIMVEVFTDHMPDRMQPWLNLLSSVVGLLALLPILYGGYGELTGVIEDGAYFFGDLELPEWPGRAAFLIGYFFFVLRLAVLTGIDLLSVVGRKSENEQTTNDGQE